MPGTQVVDATPIKRGRGRPRIGTERIEAISIGAPASDIRRWQREARQQGISFSGLIRNRMAQAEQ